MGKLREVLFYDKITQGGAFVDTTLILTLAEIANHSLTSLSSCGGHKREDQGWFKAAKYPYIEFHSHSNTYHLLRTLTSIFNLLNEPNHRIVLKPEDNPQSNIYALTFGIHRIDEPPDLKLAKSQLDLYKFWTLLTLLDESQENNVEKQVTQLHLIWLNECFNENADSIKQTMSSIITRKEQLPLLLNQYHLLLNETQTPGIQNHHPFE